MTVRRVLLLCLFLGAPLSGLAQGRVEHVVVVSIDGLRPAYYLEPDRHGLQVPMLRRLVAAGAFAVGMQSVFPTLTYPAHTSLVTGVPPRRHGIFLNEAPDPELRFGLRWYAEDIRARTLYQAAEEKGLRTALVFWPVSLGARADAVFPEFWRGDRDDPKLLRALSTPGLVRGVEERFPDFWFDTPPNTQDKDLAHVAVYLIQTLRPHLLLLHMIQVDHVHHDFGLGSPEARQAVENADAQLGRIVRAVEETGLWERTVLFVVSDHGFAAVERIVRPAVLLRRAGLLSADEHGWVTGWKAATVCGGGTCEVLLEDPTDGAAQKEVLEIFSPLPHDPASGVGRIYSPEETAALSPDPGAFIILEAAPGFHFSSAREGEVVEPSKTRASHGYNPERPDQYASFLVAGAGVRHKRLEKVSLLDIAPTIAFLLGLELPGAEGRVLRELFGSGRQARSGAPH
ncbi:MAG: alkaline phosphatase family protein [Acidobacteria bacterium]|nr:alkaline phosphatase family protein [Acidobacteriota bacterium]